MEEEAERKEEPQRSYRPRISGVIAREVDDDLLLLDIESDLIHQLNRTARLVWQGCEECRSAAEIAARLANEYEVEQDIAIEDVVTTLKRMRTLNLIVAA